MKQIILNEQETKVACAIHKEIMESFAKRLHKYNDDKNFEIFAVSMAITISNMMGSWGIKNIEPFLKDLFDIIMKIHENVQKNCSYMAYNKGEKIGEGQFN